MNVDKYIEAMISDLTKTTTRDWVELTSTATLLEVDGIISDWSVSQSEQSEGSITGLKYTGESIESRHIPWIERYYNAKGNIEGTFKFLELMTELFETLTPDEEEDNISTVFLSEGDEITIDDQNLEMIKWILDNIKITDNEKKEEEEE